MADKEKAGNPIGKKTKGFWGDFKKFITKGNIIDLAVAVVIGAAFGKIITSLVANIITPLTGMFLKSGDISSLKWVLSEGVIADEAAGVAAIPEVAVTYGVFLQNIIDFVVIAFVIFIVLRVIVNLKKKTTQKETAAAAEKAKAEEEKKKTEAAIAAQEVEHQNAVKNQLANDVNTQATLLKEIRDIMKRIESK